MIGNTNPSLFTIRLTCEGVRPDLVSPSEGQRDSIRATFAELRRIAGDTYDQVNDVDLFAQQMRDGEQP